MMERKRYTALIEFTADGHITDASPQADNFEEQKIIEGVFRKRFLEHRTAQQFDPENSSMLDGLTFIIEALQGKNRKG